jgi:hypothetical protein
MKIYKSTYVMSCRRVSGMIPPCRSKNVSDKGGNRGIMPRSRKDLRMSIEKKSLTANRTEVRKLSARKNKLESTKVSATKLYSPRAQGGGTVKVGS